MTQPYHSDDVALPEGAGDEARKRLYADGCVPIRRADYRPSQDFLDGVAKLIADPANLENNSKNAGTASVKNAVINANAPLFIDFLFVSGLWDRVQAIAPQALHFTNLMHLVTPPGNDGLGWHRDTHVFRGTFTGNVPPVLKVIVYTTPVGEGSAGIEILRGTHRIDLQHPWVDKLLGLVRFRALELRGEAGDGLLFDTSVLHRRGRTAAGSTRSATIWAFATAPWQVDPYRANHAPVIERFEAHGRGR